MNRYYALVLFILLEVSSKCAAITEPTIPHIFEKPAEEGAPPLSPVQDTLMDIEDPEIEDEDRFKRTAREAGLDIYFLQGNQRIHLND